MDDLKKRYGPPDSIPHKLKRLPAILPFLIITAIIAILFGQLAGVLVCAASYVAFMIGAVLVMVGLALVARENDEPGTVSYIVAGICLLWSLSLIVWFFSIGHLIDFFKPTKRPWVNYSVRKQVRRFFRRRQ